MMIYRLDPIDPKHWSWKFSEEKDTLWTCAATPKEARDLVAAKTGLASFAEPGAVSPWQDDKVTTCVAEPSMSYPGAGEVIREDGSRVDF